MTALLSVAGLSRSFGERAAIADVDFTLSEGSRVALLGPNGAGKTTLIKLIGGVMAPDRGQIAVAGLPPEKARTTPGLIGWLPERAPLNPDLTVVEHLQLTAAFLGLSPEKAQAQVDQLAEALNLGPKLKRLSGQLSLGSRRQAALAIALMGPPRLLILDEPTSSLDPEEVHRLRDCLSSLPATATFLISSHVIEEAAKSTDEAIILKAGRLIARKSWAELGPDLEAGYLATVGDRPSLKPRDVSLTL
jgi:ABC-2 type transport system ATP-binding protein